MYIGKDKEILCVYPDGTTRELQIPYYGGSYGMAVEGDVLLICYPNRLDGRQVNLLDGSVEPVSARSLPIEVGRAGCIRRRAEISYRMKNWLLRYRIERSGLQTARGRLSISWKSVNFT